MPEASPVCELVEHGRRLTTMPAVLLFLAGWPVVYGAALLSITGTSYRVDIDPTSGNRVGYPGHLISMALRSTDVAIVIAVLPAKLTWTRLIRRRPRC